MDLFKHSRYNSSQLNHVTDEATFITDISFLLQTVKSFTNKEITGHYKICSEFEKRKQNKQKTSAETC